MASAADPPFSDLIPEMRAWNNGAGIDIESWTGCTGNTELAIGYSVIFWPRFARYKHYVVRSGLDREEYISSWERQDVNDTKSLEAVVNHLHIADIHAHGTAATESQLRYLGRVLKEIHEVKLAFDFPNTSFEVFFNDEPGLPLEDYQITFWQISS